MDVETEVLSELLDFWLAAQNGPVDGPGNHLARLVDLLMRGCGAELWFRCMPRINMHISRPGVSTQIQRLVDGARAATGDRNWSLKSTADMLEAWLLLWQAGPPKWRPRFKESKKTPIGSDSPQDCAFVCFR